jgi:hypothetical protein
MESMPKQKNPFLILHIRLLDGQGNMRSEPAPISVKDDGSADLSALPEEFRNTLETLGVKDELGNARVFPNEGERFIKLLMKHSGRHWFCATSPEPVDE